MNILVVDGYNIIGDWDDLKRLKDHDMAQARDLLIEQLSEYQSFAGDRVIVVFDAYLVKGLTSKLSKSKIEIIYTKEKETADECIERIVKGLKNVENQVYVATSDYAEQRTVFGRGALRKSARELRAEMDNLKAQIKVDIAQYKKKRPRSKIPLQKGVQEIFERWRRGDK